MEQPPRILIATPGRLVDHLENTPNFARLFSDLKVIVYDEADRLLDQGFRRELDKILTHLPDKTKVKRQALLFSATVSAEIKVVAKSALASNYKFISTLRDDEVNTHKHGGPCPCTDFFFVLPIYSAPAVPHSPLLQASRSHIRLPPARPCAAQRCFQSYNILAHRSARWLLL